MTQTLARLASLLFLTAAVLAAAGTAEASRWLGAGPGAVPDHGELIPAVCQTDAPGRLAQHGLDKASRSSCTRQAPAADGAPSPIVSGETPSRQAAIHSDYRSCHSPPRPLSGAAFPGLRTPAGEGGGMACRDFPARTAPPCKPSQAGREHPSRHEASG